VRPDAFHFRRHVEERPPGGRPPNLKYKGYDSRLGDCRPRRPEGPGEPVAGRRSDSQPNGLGSDMHPSPSRWCREHLWVGPYPASWEIESIGIPTTADSGVLRDEAIGVLCYSLDEECHLLVCGLEESPLKIEGRRGGSPTMIPIGAIGVALRIMQGSEEVDDMRVGARGIPTELRTERSHASPVLRSVQSGASTYLGRV
jgi:hypothetical protein